MTAQDMHDIIAFLKTLSDGWRRTPWVDLQASKNRPLSKEAPGRAKLPCPHGRWVGGWVGEPALGW